MGMVSWGSLLDPLFGLYGQSKGDQGGPLFPVFLLLRGVCSLQNTVWCEAG